MSLLSSACFFYCLFARFSKFDFRDLLAPSNGVEFSEVLYKRREIFRITCAKVGNSHLTLGFFLGGGQVNGVEYG